MLCKKCRKDIPADSIFCPYCAARQVSAEHKTKSRGNGTGCVYQLPNKTWRAEVTKGYTEGKRRARTKSGFKTKKEALAYLPQLIASPLERSATIAALYAKWSATHYENLSDSKITAYKIAYNKISHLYNRKISDLITEDLQNVVNANADTYYTRRDIKVLLNQIYKYAIKNNYCSTNYADYIELPKLEKSQKDAFNKEELESLWLDYTNGNEFTGYILVMIYTGMRYGEISTILKENVHLSERYLIGGIKTDAGKNRRIPLADKILPIVTKMYSKGHRKLLEMNEDNFRSKYKETLERAAVRPLSPHCCRHTFSTLMAEAGVQPAIIKETAGHKNYSKTLGYTHIPLDTALDSVNKI